ncbi:hypothetical protein LOK49_LG06G02542 [Camellia lanceoleosa]|uniref:Uncharacterized protein n=1 Tax=Camellia lanceoleosa TaxID=1840588 RepID=A0ACC0H9X4_9ERIC|nr:hypothetical protein LOK49_LG06G02542 [Camellia lanceoleosa]
MKGMVLQTPSTISRGKLPLLALVPCYTIISRRAISTSPSLRCRELSRLKSVCDTIRAQASNVGVGSAGYGRREENDNQKIFVNDTQSDSSSKIGKPPNRIPYLLSLASVLFGCAFVYSLIAFVKGGPSAVLAAIAKSGFTAAFSLIFVSEIGDKTFFIAALLAMQYEKGLVLLGSMGALSLMTVLSVIIGRIFHSVPRSFRQVSKRLLNPLEILWESFSLVFFAEWGDRSMLATIALGAAQSPWGVASGAIVGHLIATSIAIVGGAFLANFISEKLVGYLGGALFLIFSVATFLGVF